MNTKTQTEVVPTLVLAEYLSEEAKGLKPGMYLALFHGREFPEQEMEDWGLNGPMIPVLAVHTTYKNIIRVRCPSEAVALTIRQRAGSDTAIADAEWVELKLHDDMVVFDNKFYGDWTVHAHNLGE